MSSLNRFVQAADHSVRRALRRATANRRALPDVIVIGAQRSGTTSLFRSLTSHPEIQGSSVKEVHYFDEHHERGVDWYRSFFPFRSSEYSALLEATPFYMTHPHAPRRIAEELPKAKLVAVLRDPTDRAISHYRFSVSLGREDLKMLDAMKAEEDRISDEWERLQKDPEYKSPRFRAFSYKARGHYAEQLARFAQLGERNRMLVIKMSRLRTGPTEVLNELASFIGVAPFPERSVVARVNASPALDVHPSVTRYLDAYFEPHNERLRSETGIEF